jgi:AraC-like DNA-binding protein
MAGDILDKLLTTLNVRLEAFAMCEIQDGYRLAFDPMEAATIHYVLDGRGVLQVGDVSVSFSRDCVVIVPARARQSVGAVNSMQSARPANENCEIIADGILKFTAGDGAPAIRILCGMVLATYGGALGLFDHLNEPMAESVENVEPLRRAFQQMLGELENPGVGTRAMTEALMKQCLVLLLRQHLVHHSIDSPFFASLQDRRLARAVTAILERPAAPHTIDGLAHLAGMSRSSFTERFVQVFGLSAIDFLHNVRMRLAAHLLTTTDLPVKVVATSIGYKSRSYFSRTFRASFGQDPAGFRAISFSSDDPY